MVDSPIYSKIEYSEAVSAKRNLLSAQASILNIIKKIENYKILRKREFILKLKLKDDLSETKANINKILKDLPQIPKTKLLNVQDKQFKSEREIKKSSDIESELAEIKNKLASLGK